MSDKPDGIVRVARPRADLRADWFTAAATVGITAGTSTPDAVIDRIDLRVRELGSRQANPTRCASGGER